MEVHRQISCEPISGWPLERLLELDEVAPGLLRDLTRASDLRRQMAFHVLALWMSGNDGASVVKKLRLLMDDSSGLTDSEVVCRSLLALAPRALFICLHGTGLVGLHKRLGPEPLRMRDYLTIGRIVRSGSRKRIKTMLQLDNPRKIDFELIEAVPTVYLHPRVITAVRTLPNLKTLLSAIDLLKAMDPNLCDADLAGSLNQINSWKGVTNWIERRLKKGRFLHLPDLDGVPQLRVIATGQELIAASRRFQNCMANHIGDVAVGRAAFVECMRRPAIIHLVALCDGQWMLEAIHGIANTTVDRELTVDVIRTLRSKGVLLPRGVVDGNRFNAVYELVGNSWAMCENYGDLTLNDMMNVAWSAAEDEAGQMSWLDIAA